MMVCARDHSRSHFSSHNFPRINDKIRNLQMFIYFSLLRVKMFRSCLVNVRSITDLHALNYIY